MTFKKNGNWKDSIYNPKEFRKPRDQFRNTGDPKPTPITKSYRPINKKSFFKLFAWLILLLMLFTLSKCTIQLLKL